MHQSKRSLGGKNAGISNYHKLSRESLSNDYERVYKKPFSTVESKTKKIVVSPSSGRKWKPSTGRSSEKDFKPTTIKQAMKKYGHDQHQQLGVEHYDYRHLEKQANKYEQILDQLDANVDSPASESIYLDPNILSVEDNKFKKKWDVTREYYKVDRSKAFQRMIEFLRPKAGIYMRDDHTKYLQRKEERLKTTADKLEELKSKQNQYLEERRNAMQQAAVCDRKVTDPLKQYYKTRPELRPHVHRLRRDTNDENLIEDIEALDSAVKSWEAPTRTLDKRDVADNEVLDPLTKNAFENTPANYMYIRRKSTDEVMSDIEQAISEVDACIISAEGIRPGNSRPDPKAEALYHNIEKLSQHVMEIESSYHEIIAPFLAPHDYLGTIEDIGGFAYEGYEDMYNSSAREEYQLFEDENTRWDNFYDTQINEYLTLKAMMTGKVDDNDAFDRKVFAFNLEQGKCPVSWREIFSMARLKLRELVCYPYANDEQIQLLMLMENSNIFTAWQSEVMNRIKDKLQEIRHNLKMSLMTPGNRLKGAAWRLTHSQHLRLAEKQTNMAEAYEPVGSSPPPVNSKADRESKYYYLLRKVRGTRLKEQQKMETSNIKDLEKEAGNHSDRVWKKKKHQEEACEAPQKTIKHVRSKLNIKQKIRTLRMQTRDIISSIKQIHGNDHTAPASIRTRRAESDEEDTALQTAVPCNNNTSLHLYGAVLVDRHCFDSRRYILIKFINAGYTEWDLLNRRCMCTSLNVSPLLPLTSVREPNRCMSCGHAVFGTSRHSSFAQFADWLKGKQVQTLYSEVVTLLKNLSNSDFMHMSKYACAQEHQNYTSESPENKESLYNSQSLDSNLFYTNACVKSRDTYTCRSRLTKQNPLQEQHYKKELSHWSKMLDKQRTRHTIWRKLTSTKHQKQTREAVPKRANKSAQSNWKTLNLSLTSYSLKLPHLSNMKQKQDFTKRHPHETSTV